jgi:hypothetical protein
MMANRFYNYLVNNLRTNRYSVGNTAGLATRLYTFGAIYEGNYINYKQDRNPLVWIQWSDPKYTHGINLHYLDRNELIWLGRTIAMIRKYQQVIDGKTFYYFFKQQKLSIVKKAYRIYHTSLCNYKLVSAGITDMADLCYSSRNPFIAELNRTLTSNEIKPQYQVAYSTTELRERIVEAQNSKPLHSQQVSSFGRAPWAR